jgi:pimeloyl-ACP methyl ester carboxylesterase
MRLIIENAGHFPWIEQPTEVAKAFATFAREVTVRDVAEAP